MNQRLTLVAAILFFGVAIAAGYLGWLRASARAEQIARKEAQAMAMAECARERAQLMAIAEVAAKQRAQENFTIARQTVDDIIAQVARLYSAGVPLETVKNVPRASETAVDG